MKKLLSFLVISFLYLSTILPAFALMAPAPEMSDRMASPMYKPSNEPSAQIEYPVGEDFEKLRTLIESNFSKSKDQYGYGSNCIASRTLCSNYKYTSVIEKAIKLIVLRTYSGNEEFYNTLFANARSYGDITNKNTLKNIIDMIPRGSSLSDWKSLGFGKSIGGELMEASFGVNFTGNANSSSMLGAIEQKIKDMKRSKCEQKNRGNYNNTRNSTNDCYSNDLSNIYLPTQEELYAESIYLNRGSVKIETLKDEIEYVVSGNQDPGISDEWKQSIQKNINPKIQNVLNERTGTKMSLEFVEKTNEVLNGPTLEGAKSVLQMIEDIKIKTPSLTGNEGELTYWIEQYMKGIVGKLQSQGNVSYEEKLSMQKSVYIKLQNVLDERGNLVSSNGVNPVVPQLSPEFIKKIQEVIANPTFDGIKIIQQMSDTIKFQTSSFSKSENELLFGLNQYLQAYLSRYTDQKKNLSYILRYKKDTYTLEEARAELEKGEKNDNSNEEYIVTDAEQKGQIPCKKYTAYQVRSQCVLAQTSLREVQTAIMAYNVDNVTYPDTLDKLNGVYIMKFPQAFTDNFSYKLTKNSRGESDYEIRYIGRIGEGVIGMTDAANKKDYKAMMSGATVPVIPTIFAHVPSDSMVLYIRNPANLIDILNQKSNTSQRLSGMDVSESIKNFMKTFFELEKFEQIEKNLKHDMAIVVNNLDATAPDIVIILSESDRDALSPTGKARVVGSKDGYIFIASSKESLEKLTNLTIEKSLANAPDFHYVWWKKSALVRDAMMFVGDEFFAKMLTLETYLTHYRKYRDYARLNSLQELTWAYGDAFGSVPSGFSEFTSVGLSALTGEVLREFSIVNGLVTHQNIGTLKSLKTLPEARYDISKITRSELDDYKYNVLQYRDIWRASLDPMGIVINRYGDGLEIDFFMTPIPSSPDRDIQQIQNMFEGVTKDSFSFVTNPKIRMGLVSFIWGFDSGKIQNKIQSTTEISKGFEEFSKEVLDGKNIFDYIAGEFAFSVGNLDPDMLDGWNIEKIDVYGSVQVTSEEKGKELIDILRTRILKEMGNARGDEVEMIKGFLAKPLIEDYSGKKIYYVEGLPIPFVGKIGFAYTFVDDFFIIGPNKSTIKNVIDIAKNGDSAKKNIVTKDSFEKGTFFATLFDGVNMSKQLKGLYEKNKSSIPRYARYLDMEDITNDSSIDHLMGAYYNTQDRNRRLSIDVKPFSYTVGALEILGDTEKLMVKINTSGIKTLSGVTLQMWNNIESDNDFPKDILSNKGIPLAEFLALPNIGEYISLNIIVQLDNAMGGTESLLRNVTFGMNMGNDEIGFRLRIFRNSDAQAFGGGKLISLSSSLFLGIFGGVIFLLILFGGFILFRRNQKNLTNNSVNSIILGGDDQSQVSKEGLTMILQPAVPEPVISTSYQSFSETSQESPPIVPQVPLPEIQIKSSTIITTPDSSLDTLEQQQSNKMQ